MLHTILLPALMPSFSLAPAMPATPTEPAYAAALVEPPLAAGALSATATGTVPRRDDDSTFSYSYIEIGATRFDAEDIDDEADTYYGEVSFDLFNLVNLFVNYENLSIDVDNFDTDIWRLGVGVHFSTTEFLDLTADLAWLFSKIDSDTIDDDSNGTQVRIGARWMVLDAQAAALELFGRAIAINLDDSIYSDDSSTGFDAGARVHFLGSLSVAGSYTKIENDDAIGLGLRVSF